MIEKIEPEICISIKEPHLAAVRIPNFNEEAQRLLNVHYAAVDLLEVAILEKALDCPLREGALVLERHGYNKEIHGRATLWVQQKREAAINKALHGNKS